MNFLIMFFTFIGILPGLNSHIGEWDEVWQKRAEEARNRTIETYEPIPEHVVAHLNVNAKRYLCHYYCISHSMYIYIYIEICM